MRSATCERGGKVSSPVAAGLKVNKPLFIRKIVWRTRRRDDFFIFFLSSLSDRLSLSLSRKTTNRDERKNQMQRKNPRQNRAAGCFFRVNISHSTDGRQKRRRKSRGYLVKKNSIQSRSRSILDINPSLAYIYIYIYIHTRARVRIDVLYKKRECLLGLYLGC